MTTNSKPEEILQSAARREFVVGLRSHAGAKPYTEQVVVVKAYSTEEAKHAAVRKLAVGKFKNRKLRDWVITYVDAATLGGENGESGEANG